MFLEKALKLKILPIRSEQIFRMSEDKCFDHSKAKKDFGFNPIGFDKGIIFQFKEMLDKGCL